MTGFSHISIQIRYAHTLPASSFPSKYVSSHQRHITLCYSPKIMVRKNMVNMVTCYLFFINIMCLLLLPSANYFSRNIDLYEAGTIQNFVKPTYFCLLSGTCVPGDKTKCFTMIPQSRMLFSIMNCLSHY